MMKEIISRKAFIKGSAVTLAGIPFGLSALADITTPKHGQDKRTASAVMEPGKVNISIFSKHLQWLNYKDMAELAAKLGFDGVDLTVRRGGHVAPDKVRDDLPKAFQAIRDAGLKVYTITTDITRADDPNTVNILQAASQLGIKNYRMGWYKYDTKLDMPDNLELFKKYLAGLAAINERYQIHGDYENHGHNFGGAIWDLWLGLKDLNPKWIGCQYDIRHATVDGGEAWPTNLSLLKKHIGSLTFKDFHWSKTNDKWKVESVPLGEGMIDFKHYFELIKEYGLYSKPISLHYEYPLGGADKGAAKLTIPANEVIKAIQKDLTTLRSWLQEYGIS